MRKGNRIMLTAKILFATATGFLAGVLASPFVSEQPIVPKKAPIVAKHSVSNVTQNSADDELHASIEAVKAMLIEQSIRLESAEEGINYLLDSSSLANQSHYSADTHIHKENISNDAVIEEQKDSASYQQLSAYVDAQLQAGTWSKDNAYHMLAETANLSHTSRTEIQLRIVQAINEGQLEIEDPSIPLF